MAVWQKFRPALQCCHGPCEKKKRKTKKKRLQTLPAASNIEKTEREVLRLAYRVTEHLSHILANTSVQPCNLYDTHPKRSAQHGIDIYVLDSVMATNMAA